MQKKTIPGYGGEVADRKLRVAQIRTNLLVQIDYDFDVETIGNTFGIQLDRAGVEALRDACNSHLNEIDGVVVFREDLRRILSDQCSYDEYMRSRDRLVEAAA